MAKPPEVFERYLTRTEERALLACIAECGTSIARRDLAWMRLLRQTGIRIGTLCKLTVGDARNALATHHLEVKPGAAKGQHGYTVFLTDKARRALSDLLRSRLDRGHAPILEDLLMVSRHGVGISERQLQKRMAYWIKRAGLSVRATPHWWRHTLAHRLIDSSTAQDPLGVVQASLGHRSRVSTAIYTRPSREDVRAALEAASR